MKKASALLLALAAGCAHADGASFTNRIDGYAAYQNLRLSTNIGGTTFKGPGGGIHILASNKSPFFLDLQADLLSEKDNDGGADIHGSIQNYRAGFGYRIGMDTPISGAVRVGFIHIKGKASLSGVGSLSEQGNGWTVHGMLFGGDGMRVTPYMEGGYIHAQNARGPEGTLGISVNISPNVGLFLEHTYTRLHDSAQDVTFKTNTDRLGLRVYLGQ